MLVTEILEYLNFILLILKYCLRDPLWRCPWWPGRAAHVHQRSHLGVCAELSLSLLGASGGSEAPRKAVGTGALYSWHTGRALGTERRCGWQRSWWFMFPLSLNLWQGRVCLSAVYEDLISIEMNRNSNEDYLIMKIKTKYRLTRVTPVTADPHCIAWTSLFPFCQTSLAVYSTPLGHGFLPHGHWFLLWASREHAKQDFPFVVASWCSLHPREIF